MAFRHNSTISFEGEFWFAEMYAASLIGTTRRKIEIARIRGLIEAREIEGQIYYRETLITSLRRDPQQVKELKKQLVEKAAPTLPEIGGKHSRHKDQDVLPIADYRLPLRRGNHFKD